MAQQTFMIAPYETGWQNDRRPWLIPNDAFQQLRNAYIYRGRVRKRWGTFLLNQNVADADKQLHSRLRVKIDTTDGSGNTTGGLTVPGSRFEVGQLFSIGSTVFTVSVAGTPASLLRSDGSGATATYNTSTGAVVIQSAPANTDVYFYPAEPVMGIILREEDPSQPFTLVSEETIAFDTQFAYTWDGLTSAWDRITGVTFTGGEFDYFWGANWRGLTADARVLFVTNGTTDGVYGYDGSTWTSLKPAFNAAGDTIETAQIVIPFRDRLLLFNTVEKISGANKTFPFRLRYSQNGSPFSADAWKENIPGRGGFLDAPTSQAIKTVDRVQDRLIIYFERSTYELAWTGNEIVPFVWKRIDSEIGAESQFSIVHFDEAALGVGRTGIHACDGSRVQRVDEKIRDEVFRIVNENFGFAQVYGIRDYYTEQVYWSVPAIGDEPSINGVPDRLLVYNYKTGSWAFFDDSIKTFGYFYNPDTIPLTESPKTWIDTINQPEDPQDLRFFKQVLCGNQHGFTFIVDQNLPYNAPSLQITDIALSLPTVVIEAVGHNLRVGDFVLIEHVVGVTGLNGNIYRVEQVSGSGDLFSITEASASGSYDGRGVISRVNRIDIFTKEYNFNLEQGKSFHLEHVEFYVDRTSDGEITVDYSPDSGTESMVPASQSSGSIVGTNILSTAPHSLVSVESQQARLWHPVYFQAEGNVVQMRLYLTDEQMLDNDIALSDFQLHAMMFYITTTERTLQ